MEPNINFALTFDDVLLVPQESSILPTEVDTTTQLTTSLSLKTPILSAAMDTVTESETAIVMAQEGGLGVIHKNLSIVDQAAQVARVKKYESGVVKQPVTLAATDALQRAHELRAQLQISGFPVVDAGGRLVGMLTNRDIRAANDAQKPVSSVMTPRDRVITGREGLTLDAAVTLLHQHRVEKLPIVNADDQLVGLITIKDVEKTSAYPHAAKDLEGRLRVGAAVGVGGEGFERAQALMAAGADMICIDTAHGHSQGVIELTKKLRAKYPTAFLMAGNVSTGDGAKALVKAGASAVKIGQGPGSICTTRIVSGCGMPQLTALLECAPITRAAGVALISDGGIKYSGDLVKAMAAGADAVMIGSLFAGTDEAPGEKVLYQGRSYKLYRGMGSLSAMLQGSRDRYGQGSVRDARKLVPEGVEGRVPYRGRLADTLYQLVGGLRSGMGYVGAATVKELRDRARFVQITNAGLKESHVHDVTITQEAPNYSGE